MPRIRATSGGKEEQIVGRARELRRNPEALLPKLTDDCPTAPFDRLREELKKVQEAADDPEALKRLIVRGSDLSRAYAALLLFLKERPDVVTAVGRFSTGTIPYLALGNPPPEAQIAVQYYSDPRRLLMGYYKLAKGGLFGGGGLHFYAMEDRVICTGKEGSPPDRFVAQAVARLPYRLNFVESPERGYVCQHLQRGELQPHLAITWEAARATIKVCRRCAREDTHLLGSLLDNMAVPDPMSGFSITLEYPVQHHHEGSCLLADLQGHDSGSEKTYRRGKLSDAALLAEFVRNSEESIRSSRNPCFVAGGHCYSTDVKAFTESLSPTEAEKIVLSEMLPTHGSPLLVPERTSGKTLEVLWKDRALDILRIMGTDDAEAERLLSEFQSSPGRVSELVERLHRKGRERAILSQLPEYAETAAEAAFAISISRLYRTQGPAAVEQQLISTLPEEEKVKGLAWGFLVAMGRGADKHEWRFTNTEREFGSAHAAQASKLLSASPEEYHEALSSLLAAAGVVHWGRKVP